MIRLAYRLVAVALSAALSLLAAEAVLRIMNMGFGNSPMEPDPYLHHVHPKNYSFVQQHPSGELGGFRIDYNAEGRVHRGAGFAPPAQPACRIALMGDSFTEGGQVPFAESFAGLLEAAAPRCEVRNYGVRGPTARRSTWCNGRARSHRGNRHTCSSCCSETTFAKTSTTWRTQRLTPAASPPRSMVPPAAS